MLGKFNAERLNSTVKNLKRQGQYAISTLGKRYKEAKDIANTVDRYMNQARRIHSDLQPTINEAGGERGKQINDKVKRAFSSYDSVRDRVVDVNNQAEKHVGAVVGALKKEGINIGL